MKKVLFYCMIGIMLALHACDVSEPMETSMQDENFLATFSVETLAQTRSGTQEISRYIVEAHEVNNSNETPIRVVNTTGSLSLKLKKNTSYMFLFWADDGSTYNAENLTEITHVVGDYYKPGTPAYCLNITFNSDDFEQHRAITLKNATAQINYITTKAIDSSNNTLRIESDLAKLNLATGESMISGGCAHTFTGISEASEGAIIATDYLLAPTTIIYFESFILYHTKIKFNDEPDIDIPYIPIKQNWITNITGDFCKTKNGTFTVSIDKTWGQSQEMRLPKTGDFVYDDDTYSSTLDPSKTCIGIFLKMQDQDALVLHLHEPEENWSDNQNPAGCLTWGPTNIYVGATNSNGKDNQSAVEGQDITKFPAFNWAKSNNGFIPSISELMELYDSKDVLNKSLQEAGGTILSDDYYCSSTEGGGNMVWGIRFSKGRKSGTNKDKYVGFRILKETSLSPPIQTEDSF